MCDPTALYKVAVDSLLAGGSGEIANGTTVYPVTTSRSIADIVKDSLASITPISSYPLGGHRQFLPGFLPPLTRVQPPRALPALHLLPPPRERHPQPWSSPATPTTRSAR